MTAVLYATGSGVPDEAPLLFSRATSLVATAEAILPDKQCALCLSSQPDGESTLAAGFRLCGL